VTGENPDEFYIVLVEGEEPAPLQGPFPTYDAAVDANYEAAIEAGYEPEEHMNAHLYYQYDDSVRIGRLLSSA